MTQILIEETKLTACRDNSSLGSTFKQKLLRPFSRWESTLLFVTVFFILFDAFTTITFYVTVIGIETNIVLSILLQINPFLVYPFLLSMLIPVLIFRFHSPTEYGTIIILIITHSLASLNNLSVIFYRSPIVLTYFEYLTSGTFSISFIAYIVGAFYIGAYSVYLTITNKMSLFNSAKSTSLNFLIYLASYLFLNIIPFIWLIIF